ncbi:antibiotic biosynthesis monooxygenase [Geothrix alkalitolerans]|uniref:antibiotic biosynthesis monooxygenase n=1 Tax=Geothrix alkalitolerans TaxID=2922724 RepID=UPI001FAF71BF|nr:antibiotic biosynthesis monooxygenase [Geothrix alkalitolerans]
MSPFSLDLDREPGLCFLHDAFTVPEAARAAFTDRMQQNLAFIRTLPGFRGHLVLEQRDGASAFNLVTLAAWASRDAYEAAGREVRAHYQRLGFDLPAALKGWGVEMVRGIYQAAEVRTSRP